MADSMPTYAEYLAGKVKWAKVYEPDLKYACWSIVLYPEKESYDKLMDLKKSTEKRKGILNEIKMDEEGQYYIKIKRDSRKLTRDGRELVFHPPEVIGPDGQPFKEPIGNGSDVKVEILVRQYKSFSGQAGLAIRLNKLQVVNLVEYKKEDHLTPEQLKGFHRLEAYDEPAF